MPEIIWGRYQEAYQAIHNAILSNIASAPENKKITKISLEWTDGKFLKKLKTYQENELLFTLEFTWNPDGTLKSITRLE